MPYQPGAPILIRFRFYCAVRARNRSISVI